MLRMVNCLDDEAIITRKIKKAAAFTGRTDFRQYMLVGQRHLNENSERNSAHAVNRCQSSYHVICSVNVKPLAQCTEHPRRVVFEFKIVFDTRS